MNIPMKYSLAISHVKSGSRIKRPHWYACLIYRNGRVEFEKVPKGLTKTYKPPGIDMCALDWEIVS